MHTVFLIQMGTHLVSGLIRQRCNVILRAFDLWSDANTALEHEVPDILVISYLQFDMEVSEMFKQLDDDPLTCDIPIILLLQQTPSAEVAKAMHEFSHPRVIAKLDLRYDLLELIRLIKEHTS